jgi:hypothetical protein
MMRLYWIGHLLDVYHAYEGSDDDSNKVRELRYSLLIQARTSA